METLNSLSARSLQYYVIAKKWSSDLDFYKVEIRFLRSLLEEYFYTVANMGEEGNFKQISNELMKLEVDKNQTDGLLNDQITQLELMSEDVIYEDVTALTGKQIKLEYMVTKIFNEYKEVKKKIFQLVEKVLEINNEPHKYVFPN
jgi:hypothetical protein